MSEYAKVRECKGNIDAKKLIVTHIHFHQWQVELAIEKYNKATLNHDYQSILEANIDKAFNAGKEQGLIVALRCILAQEAEANGRRPSADMSEFDEVIEELLYP
jgi:hypothetical protein